MILFLYGADSFRSTQKLNAIKAKYINASLGDTNLSILDFQEKKYDFTEITRTILAFPFLSKSRLVILENLLKDGNKDIQEKIGGFLEKVPQSTNLVFYEAEPPDRRSSLFKKLNKPVSPSQGGPKMSQEFKMMEVYELRNWIKNEIKSNNVNIEDNAIEKLIEYVGNDLWRMSNEISKLISYTGTLEHKNIKTEDVELLVKPRVDGNIFGMIDAIGEKNIGRAIKLLHDLIESGEHELYLLTMIIYQFRNLLIIKDYLENTKVSASVQNPIRDGQISNFQQISNVKFQMSKNLGLNPYVVEKTIYQCKNFTFQELKEIYKNLFAYDEKIKTGKIDPKIAIDLLVTELCS